jgi:hypothetical protein
MHPNAITQAEIRFQKAQEASSKLQEVTAFADAESAWSDFLSAASTIYSKLEQGAKTSGKSAAWFGRKKKDRKDDPLLSYIHHARNSDEHGIENITSRHQSYKMPDNNPIGLLEIIVPEGKSVDDIALIAPDGTRHPVQVPRHNFIRMQTVTDSRYGDDFPVPETHLGKPLEIDQITPSAISILALSYLKDLIAEATDLAK